MRLMNIVRDNREVGLPLFEAGFDFIESGKCHRDFTPAGINTSPLLNVISGKIVSRSEGIVSFLFAGADFIRMARATPSCTHRQNRSI